MYLYLHKNDSIESKPRTELISEDRSDFSDYMVKKILRDYSTKKDINFSEEKLEDIRIIRDKKGKPYFLLPYEEEQGFVNKQPIHYSVSHSGAWWGCMIADEPLGFDLEMHREKVNHLKIAKRYFTEMEYQYILQAGIDGFYKIWVRKEAYVKFLGSGLANVLDSFSVIKDMELSPVIISTKKDDEQELPLCRIKDCFIEKGIEAAYCSINGNPIKEIIML